MNNLCSNWSAHIDSFSLTELWKNIATVIITSRSFLLIRFGLRDAMQVDDVNNDGLTISLIIDRVVCYSKQHICSHNLTAIKLLFPILCSYSMQKS